MTSKQNCVNEAEVVSFNKCDGSVVFVFVSKTENNFESGWQSCDLIAG